MTDKTDKIQHHKEKKPEDSRLWGEITRDIIPLKGKKTISPAIKKPKEEKSSKPTAKKLDPTHQKNTSKNLQKPEIDHRTSERLRKGQMPIEGRLDLHGMTREAAYDALSGFIPRCYARGFRCILVVTGKGARGPLEPETGILKKMTPEWLDTPPLNQYVLKTQSSKQKDGGGGAFYVLLKRNR